VEITEGLADQKTTLTLDLKPGGGVAIEMVPVGVAHTRPSGDAGLVVDGASYRLRAKHSGRLLGIKNGKVIQQVDMKRRKNQNPQSWKFKSIGEGHWQILCGGRALGALDKDNDSSIDLVSPNPKDPLQHWYLDHIVGSWYRIYLADTDNVLDIQGVNYSDGGCAHLWQWVNKPNQIWSLEKK
jgi:hypothetical protein